MKTRGKARVGRLSCKETVVGRAVERIGVWRRGREQVEKGRRAGKPKGE